MANRTQRRKMGKKLTVREEKEIKNLIMTIVIIAIAFGIMYLVTLFILKKGFLSKGYTKVDAPEAVINYETTTIGTVFDKAEDEYYVAFDNFGHNPNKYLETVLKIYSAPDDALKVYKVDMSYGINDKYKSNKSNKKASKSEDLRINGVTLMKVSKGKNVLYLDDMDDIAKELGVNIED